MSNLTDRSLHNYSWLAYLDTASDLTSTQTDHRLSRLLYHIKGATKEEYMPQRWNVNGEQSEQLLQVRERFSAIVERFEVSSHELREAFVTRNLPPHLTDKAPKKGTKYRTGLFESRITKGFCAIRDSISWGIAGGFVGRGAGFVGFC